MRLQGWVTRPTEKDTERPVGTEREGGPGVAGGSQVRGHRRTPASKIPSWQLSQPVCTSRSLAGPGATQRHHWGRLWGVRPGWGPFPRGRAGRRWTEERLNSSLQETWCLEILSQSRRHTHAGIKRGRKEWITQQEHTPLPLCHSQLLQRRLQGGGGKYTHASFYIKLCI